MNLIFIIYSILLIISIIAIYLAIKFSFFDKILKWKQWLLILTGILTVFLFGSLLLTGNKLNERANINMKVPTDLYSDVSYINDSLINDGVLYNHLLLMRVYYPKVILCQAKIESNNYSSVLYKRNYNLFGMKLSTSRVTTAGYGRAGYKSYSSWRESVTDYVLWQLSHNVDKMTQDEYIAFLNKIYAEDPKYDVKIKTLMKKINFKKLENQSNY